MITPERIPTNAKMIQVNKLHPHLVFFRIMKPLSKFAVTTILNFRPAQCRGHPPGQHFRNHEADKRRGKNTSSSPLKDCPNIVFEQSKGKDTTANSPTEEKTHELHGEVLGSVAAENTASNGYKQYVYCRNNESKLAYRYDVPEEPGVGRLKNRQIEEFHINGCHWSHDCHGRERVGSLYEASLRPHRPFPHHPSASERGRST